MFLGAVDGDRLNRAMPPPRSSRGFYPMRWPSMWNKTGQRSLPAFSLEPARRRALRTARTSPRSIPVLRGTASPGRTLLLPLAARSPRRFLLPQLRRDPQAEVVVVVRVEGEEEEGEEGGSSCGSLARGNFLHAEGIAPRPAHLVFGLAVRADGMVRCFLLQTRGTHDAHAPLALLTSKDLLQCSSWLGLLSSEVPPDPAFLCGRTTRSSESGL